MSEENVKAEEGGRVISHVPIVDLRFIKSAEDLKGIAAIENVGAILVPEEFASEVSRIPMDKCGGILPLPKDLASKAKLFTGQMDIGGDVLSNPEDLVVLAGMITVNPPVPEVRCKLYVAGQIFLPESCKSQVSSALQYATGQLLYYKGDKVYRLFGQDDFSADFFENLPEPITLVIMGGADIADDVTAELFRSKVTDIILFGNLLIPKHLKSTLQSLFSQKFGNVSVKEMSSDGAAQ